MNKKFGNIIKIKSGVFSKSDTNPDLFYIQSTDFDKQRNWVDNISPVLCNSPKFSNHLLNIGDILFVAKGRDFFAVVYDGRFSPAVASTTFLVLQVQVDNVIPQYITWFLNHPKTQTLLWSFAKGSGIPLLTKSVLEQIEIPIPSLSKQNTILEFSKLQKAEKRLQKQIIKLKQDYLNELTYQSIH